MLLRALKGCCGILELSSFEDRDFKQSYDIENARDFVTFPDAADDMLFDVKLNPRLFMLHELLDDEAFDMDTQDELCPGLLIIATTIPSQKLASEALLAVGFVPDMTFKNPKNRSGKYIIFSESSLNAE